MPAKKATPKKAAPKKAARKPKPTIEAVKSEPPNKIPQWEVEEAIKWLALTDSTNETARRMGRSPAAIHDIRHAKVPEIMMARQELIRDNYVEFTTAIKVIQQKVVDTVCAMAIPDTIDGQQKTLKALMDTLSMEVDKQAILLEKPTEITRMDGSGDMMAIPGMHVTEEQEAEQDKDYIRHLIEEIKEEDGGLL